MFASAPHATRARNFSTDLSKWSVHIEGISSKGDWAAGVYYKVNDVVKFGNVKYELLRHTRRNVY